MNINPNYQSKPKKVEAYQFTEEMAATKNLPDKWGGNKGDYWYSEGMIRVCSMKNEGEEFCKMEENKGRLHRIEIAGDNETDFEGMIVIPLFYWMVIYEGEKVEVFSPSLFKKLFEAL